MEEQKVITDADSRRFKTLRVSVTATCNMACSYCAPGEQQMQHARTGYRELAAMILGLHERLEFVTVHFTGGEPLVYRELVPLVEAVREAAPELVLKLTTNGLGLAEKASALAAAGIREVNVSLDAITAEAFSRITGIGGRDRVLGGLEAARSAGLQVKVNCVVMRGSNEDQVVPLFRYMEARNIPVRYLELMKMGHLHRAYRECFVSMKEILFLLARADVSYRALGRAPSGTACYWETPGGYHFGIIANESVPFCHDCDRLRLDSNGNVYGCLSVNDPIRISGILRDSGKLTSALEKALSQKQIAFTGSTLSMKAIGG